MNSEICNNFYHINDLIEKSLEKSERNKKEVSLIAVSKNQSIENINKLLHIGQNVFGENKVQEIIEKHSKFKENINWHFIGTLQKNKIRKIIPIVTMIHSVDSLSLANQISRISIEEEITTNVLLQINISNDNNKIGFSSKEIYEHLESILSFKGINVKGLMTILKSDLNFDQIRKFYSELRNLRNGLENKFLTSLPELSMGMSNDFQIAIEEGATMVRVGKLMFGSKKK